MILPPVLLLSILGGALLAVDAKPNSRRAIARADDAYSGARRHLARRRRDLSDSTHSAAIAARQVRNPRAALERWEQRDEIELARRATPSNSVAVCLGSVGAWSQCGGQGWTSDTCCVAGYTCVYSNDYYSQCLPSTSSSAAPTSTSSTKASSTSTSSAPAATSTAQAYGQCGGIGFTPMLCPASFSCQYGNDYYSQCLPQAVTTKATTSTSTQASSTSTAPMSTASPLGQCGGLGAPTKLCPAGYVCDTTNSLFNQCLPIGSSSTTKASTSSTTAAAPLQTVLPYASCGPTPLALCPAGWRCDATNPYYFQCVPQDVYTSSSSTAVASSASAQVPSASSSTKASSTAAPTSTSTAPTALQTAGAYAQCGGQGAPVALCPATYFCAVINTYYSQCLPVTASTLSLATAPTTTATSFSTVTRSSSSSSSSAPTASASVSTCPMSNAWAQCDGFLWLSKVCCPANYYCSYQSMFYSQCVPGTGSTVSATPTSTSTSKAASGTSSSAAPSATSSQICNPKSTGSDGCTSYAVSWSGVTLASPKTFVDGGHVNYQAIPKSQYKPGQTYLTSGNGWTPQSFGVHFESLNNQPSGVYIGRNFYDWGLAAKAFPSGYCITWVQIDVENAHFGEGGQAPICTP